MAPYFVLRSSSSSRYTRHTKKGRPAGARRRKASLRKATGEARRKAPPPSRELPEGEEAGPRVAPGLMVLRAKTADGAANSAKAIVRLELSPWHRALGEAANGTQFVRFQCFKTSFSFVSGFGRSAADSRRLPLSTLRMIPSPLPSVKKLSTPPADFCSRQACATWGRERGARVDCRAAGALAESVIKRDRMWPPRLNSHIDLLF